MNAPTSPKDFRKNYSPPKRVRDDNEFLAPALEILESPPSPTRVWLLRSICLLVITAIAWGWFGHIDIIAVAQGKFQPTGRVKVIEPLVTGKVVAMKATNGTHIQAGEVLVELDRSETEADLMAANAELLSSTAEIKRRSTALATVKTKDFSAPPQIDWSEDIPIGLREREGQILLAEFGQLSASIASLQAQRDQKLIEVDKLKETIKTQTSLDDTEQQRVDMRQTLLENKAGARTAVIDATETLKLQETQLAIQQQQLASSGAGAVVLDKEIDKAVRSFVLENSQKLSDAQRQVETTQQRVARAKATIANMTLVSPIAGTVQASSITNIGQVVTSGQEIMRVVPEDSRLEIEVYVLNKDIGFIKPDQEAIVKIESFPFTRYGTIAAHVSSIAHDAIPEPDANLIEGDPARAATSSTFAGAQRTQNLVFPVTLIPDVDTINVDGHADALTPGMSASVEFKTGSRRMLEYFFSPLVELSSDSLKER